MTEHHAARRDDHSPEGPTIVRDPVCGMKVDLAKSPHHAAYGGRAYHFCSAGCLTKFQADPDRYLAPKPPHSATATANGGAIYTCPMHPEIRQIGPGSCPIWRISGCMGQV